MDQPKYFASLILSYILCTIDLRKYIEIMLVVVVPEPFRYDGPYNGLQTLPAPFFTHQIIEIFAIGRR
jgi:hypothetical protein